MRHRVLFLLLFRFNIKADVDVIVQSCSAHFSIECIFLNSLDLLLQYTLEYGNWYIDLPEVSSMKAAAVPEERISTVLSSAELIIVISVTALGVVISIAVWVTIVHRRRKLEALDQEKCNSEFCLPNLSYKIFILSECINWQTILTARILFTGFHF